MTKVNTLLIGPVGSGKTTSLMTSVAAGYRTFVIATEPGIDHILIHGDKCHWHYTPPAHVEWDILEKNANSLNTLEKGILEKMPGLNRTAYRQFIDVLQTCANFKCDVCGQRFGPIDHLPADAHVALDGMSGLAVMAMDLVAGGKPIKSLPDWGAAMDNLERFVTKLCADTKCNFTMMAHIDREFDEITGGTKVMVSTLGRKLAPRIPRFFDEVVYCRKVGGRFFWSTVEGNTDLKARCLPFSDEIPPDFGELFAAAGLYEVEMINANLAGPETL